MSDSSSKPNDSTAVKQIEALKSETGQQLLKDVNNILTANHVTTPQDLSAVMKQLEKDGMLPAVVLNEFNPDTNGKSIEQSKIKDSENRLLADVPPDQKAAVEKYINGIEQRQPPLSTDDINKMYGDMAKLIEDPDHTSPITQKSDRILLAESVLRNASLGHEIDQGFHNTCNVTTLEEKLYKQDPVKAAEMMMTIGLTGAYDGIKLDPKSLVPDGESRSDFADGSRDYASQIFSMAVINDYWQHQKPPCFYTQVSPSGQSDTGERLTYSGYYQTSGSGPEVKGPDGQPVRSPALDTRALGQIGQSLGFKGQYIISNATIDGTNPSTGDYKATTEADFEKQLAKLAQDGNMPAVIMVDGNNPLLTGTPEQGQPGWHVVTVTDYKPGAPPTVDITNQWGSKYNRKDVPISDLYNATLPPGYVADNNKQYGYGGGDEHGGAGGSGGEIWTQPAYQAWRQELFDDYWKHTKENPLNDSSLDQSTQIQRETEILQAMLADAQIRNDETMVQILTNEIKSIQTH